MNIKRKLKLKYLGLKRILYLRYLLFVGKCKVKRAIKKDGIWSGFGCACVISGQIQFIASLPLTEPETDPEHIEKDGRIINILLD